MIQLDSWTLEACEKGPPLSFSYRFSALNLALTRRNSELEVSEHWGTSVTSLPCRWNEPLRLKPDSRMLSLDYHLYSSRDHRAISSFRKRTSKYITPDPNHTTACNSSSKQTSFLHEPLLPLMPYMPFGLQEDVVILSSAYVTSFPFLRPCGGRKGHLAVRCSRPSLHLATTPILKGTRDYHFMIQCCILGMALKAMANLLCSAKAA